MKLSKALRQCYDLQDLAYRTAMAFEQLNGNTELVEAQARKSVAIAQVIRGWESCVDRSRIIRGKPLPGSLKPMPKPTRSRSVQDSPLAASSGLVDKPESPAIPTSTEQS